MANKLKQILLDIILDMQSSFVLGGLIIDKVILANEVVHLVKGKRRGEGGILAMKLDIAKANDKMEWIYIAKVLEAMGFDSRWISLIMQCVTIVRF